MNSPERQSNGRFSSKAPAPSAPSGSPPGGASLSSATVTPAGETQQQPVVSPPDVPPQTPPGIDAEAPYGRHPDGTPKKSNGGRKPGGAPAAPKKPRVVNPAPPQKTAAPIAGATPEQIAEKKKAYLSLANMMVGTTEGMLVQFLGPEWQMAEDENKRITIATAVYLESKNMPDLPPGVMLLGLIALYAIPRVNMPQTKAKLDALFGKKAPPPIPPGAQ